MNEIERQQRYEADWEQPPIPTDRIEMIRATACDKCSKGLLLAYVETLLKEVEKRDCQIRELDKEINIRQENHGNMLLLGRAYVRLKKQGYQDSCGEVAMRHVKEIIPDAFTETGVFRDWEDSGR